MGTELQKRFQKLASGLTIKNDGKEDVPVDQIREVLSDLAEKEARHVFEGKAMCDRPLRTLKQLSNQKLAEMRKKESKK